MAGSKKQLKSSRAVLDSSFLVVVGLAVLGIQIYVYVALSNVYQEYLNGDKAWWGPLYNGLTMASGSVTILAGLYGVIFLRMRKGLGLGALLGLLGVLGALGATVVSSIQSHRLNVKANPESTHPCAAAVLSPPPDLTLTTLPSISECDLWFGLEVAAATLSVVNLLLATAYLIIVCSGLCGPEDDDGGVSTSHRQETTTGPTVTSKPTVVIPSEPTTTTVAAPVVIVMTEPPQQPPDEVEAYAQKIREWTSEELEQQLELRLQKAFMIELRRELERRKKVMTAGASQHHQPQPDYDQS